MNRRDALEKVALILGGTIVGGSIFLQGCKSSSSVSSVFALTPDQIAFMDEVAEIIIPTTNTPGAKAAKVGSFMNVIVADCYEEKDQKIFVEGIGRIEDLSKKIYNKGFMDLSVDQRNSLLDQVNTELKVYTDSKNEEDPNHYFGLMKQLTLLGYFTSEVGATQALRYVAVPGKYEGCIPYAKGDKAWA